MKTSTTLVGTTIMMLLLALPAGAADYTLGIFGNANEDDTINMQDVTYTELIILEYRDETELADAKYDGKINMQDVTQIELVILGKEKELTIVDSADRIVTVKKPIERIIPFSTQVTETMRSLKAADKIVVVSTYVTKRRVFFPELVDLPCVGNLKAIDYEKIVELRPDIFFWFPESRGGALDEVADNFESLLPSSALVRISCNPGDIPEHIYIEEVMKLAFILDRKDEAEEFLDFREECLNQVEGNVEVLSDDEKPRVFYTYPSSFPGPCYTANRLGSVHSVIVNAGGINIAADMGTVSFSSRPAIDPEWVIKSDPEIILGSASIGYPMEKPIEAEMVALRDKIMSQPGWGHIAAVRSDKVYLVEARLFSSPHNFIGTAYLAKLFHPDLFEDLDPQAIHQEYIDKFCGIDFDVKNDGVFIYPLAEEI